ncbi:MAG TPA: hypothetical protein VFQ61_31420 [Polyangiaceae bacterium]|nr:hypothetical protein [Polyangiaceae bacterium]
MKGPAATELEPRGPGVMLAVGPTFGLLPQPAWGVSLEGSWRTGRWGGALSLRYLAPVEKEYRAPVELHAQAFGAHLGAWFEPWPELRLHAGGVTYAVLGRGVGSQVEGSGRVWAAGPVLGALAVPARTRHLWVGVGAELHVEVVRPSFEIVPYEQIFRSSLAVGSVFLAIAPVFR